jgi:hypothetical protein
MLKSLARLLSINPLLRFALIIVCIALLCWVVYMMWVAGFEIGAFVFILAVSFAVETKSAPLMEELKRINAEKLSNKRKNYEN